MQDFRKEFIEKLKDLLKLNCSIYTVREGGSAAIGCLDEYSDLDLGVVCADDEVENLFKQLDKYFEDNYGIENKFRTPEPSWHGHSQCYYLLKNTPYLFYVDILIEKLSAGNRFMESDRHGNSIIWFDKKDLFDPTPTSEEEVIKKCKRFYKLISDSFWILVMDVKKQIHRKNKVDAFVIYNQLLNRMALLWNLKYRPPKSDFGLRYTFRDFPQETITWLEDMLVVKDLDEMMKKVDVINNKYIELLEELKKKWG